MKKTKGQTVDLLYVNKNKEKKRTKSIGTNSSRKRNKKKTKNNSDEKINLDNEIIIGLTLKNIENKIPENTKKRKTGKKQNKKKTNNKLNQKQKNKTKKSKHKNKIIKWIIIGVLGLTTVILFMMSSIFNIKQIIVTNNSKISSEEIINLSTLKTGVNMFKTTNKTIRNNIKTNPYIEEVKIKKSLNGVITLEIQERTPTYMLKNTNKYIYINNQGYMLEISETALKLPTITGFSTTAENIKEGNRLDVEDLKKLEDIIKIMESAKNNSLADIITNIDISKSTNYKLTIESEAKTVQFGAATNINIKMLRIKEVVDQEKGVEGEIYFQDSDKTVFREKV